MTPALGTANEDTRSPQRRNARFLDAGQDGPAASFGVPDDRRVSIDLSPPADVLDLVARTGALVLECVLSVRT